MMKIITEYFRDIAATDRYFGAEPSRPEFEILQTIGDDNSDRIIEARINTPLENHSQPLPATKTQSEEPEKRSTVLPENSQAAEAITAKLEQLRAAVAQRSKADFTEDQHASSLLKKEHLHTEDKQKVAMTPVQEAKASDTSKSETHLQPLLLTPKMRVR